MLCSFFLFFLFPLLPSISVGQEIAAPNYTQHIQYTNNDGLSSNEAHCIYQDSDGFIWAGTDQGLCRFDSEEWKVYTSIDGLPDNMVIDIKEDASGHLWLLGLNGVVFRLNRSTEEIFIPEFNSTLDSIFTKYRLHEWHIDAAGTGYLSVYEYQTYPLWRSGSEDVKHDHFFRIENYQIAEQITLGEYDFAFFKWPTAACNLWAYNRAHLSGASELSSITDPATGIESFASHLELPGFSSGVNLSGAPIFLELNEQTLALAVNNRLITFDLSEKTILSEKLYKNAIVELFLDSKGGLYVGQHHQGGFFYYPNGDPNTNEPAFMEGHTITSFFEGKDQALWIGTVEAGLFRFSLSDFSPLSLTNGQLSVTKLHRLHKRVFIVCNRQSAFEIVDKEGEIHFDSILSSENTLSHLWCRSDTCVASYINGSAFLFKKGDKNSGLHAADVGKASVPLPRNRVLGYSSYLGYSIYDFVRMETEYFSSRHGSLYRVNCALKLSEDEVILGTDHGLKLVKDSIEKELLSEVLGTSFIYDVALDGMGSLWVATKGNGLYKIHLETETYTVLSTEDGLPINSIYDLEIAQGVLFGATNRGLFAVKNLDDGSEKKRIEVWGIADGFPSLQLQELASTAQHLFINCAGKLISVPLSKLVAPKTGCQIFLRGIQVNDHEKTPQEISSLKFSENNLTIRYQGFHYEQKKFPFWYKTKANDQWTQTYNTQLNLVDLVPGVYNVLVSPLPEDIPDKTLKLSFEILPPFTKTNTFLLLVIMGIIAVLTLAFWIVLSRERLNRRLLVSQQQALTSQMNPHFIFNALNSVHHFIGSGSRSLAQSYLANFSQLMRQVLDSSRSGHISLQKEIDSLKRYIELEKIRFEQGFELEFQIDEILRERVNDIRIPSMIIQPYIENAILHGLRPLESKGQLKLSFELSDPETLKISIADSGVGRAHSKSKKPSGYTSHGMSITEQRIALLNQKGRDKISVKVRDLEPSGTEVVILLPIEGI